MKTLILSFLTAYLLIPSPDANASKKSSCSKSQAIKKIAQAIFYEGANQSYVGRLAIFKVIINRIKNKRGIAAFRNTACAVVDQVGVDKRTGRIVYQFSFWHRSKKSLSKFKKDNANAYMTVMEITNYVYYHPEQLQKTGLTTQNHYVTLKRWRRKKNPLRYKKHAYNKKIIGDHIFFNVRDPRR